MNEASKIINHINKRLATFHFGTKISEGLSIDIMDCKIIATEYFGGYHSQDKANSILESIKSFYESKGYIVSYKNGFFSFWMHGEINIKKK